MGFHDITEDGAELLGALLEAILYGFSLLMFVGTIWMLVSKRATVRVNRKVFAVACALLFFSTVHLVIDITRVAQGFVLYRDTYPKGPIGYFSSLSQWTFVWKNYVYAAQTLIGDGVVIYRCYVVWKSKLLMILPVLLWCSVAVTGLVCPSLLSRETGHTVHNGSLWKWIISFYASTLTTNLCTTSLLVYRIWSVDRKASRLHGPQQSQLRPMLEVILDAGMIYSFTLVVALICFVTRTRGQFVLLNMITPIISITFYMVIIRVGMANLTNQPRPPGCPFSGSCSTTIQSGGMQVHATTLTEFKVDCHQSLPMSTMTVENSRDSSVLEHVGYMV